AERGEQAPGRRVLHPELRRDEARRLHVGSNPPTPWFWVKNITRKPTIVQTRPAMPSQVIGSSCHSGRVPATLRSFLIFTAHAHRKKATVGAMTSSRTSRTTRII